MNKWDKRFLDLCDHISAWSKDPSRKVGAVIVNDKKQIIGMGYNGFPRGVSDKSYYYESKVNKNKLVVHAEANAILNANGSVEGCTLYTNLFTCNECAKLIIQSGIKKIISFDYDINSSWHDSFNTAKLMYSMANMETKFYDR